MDFINNITNETLIICQMDDKEKLLSTNKLINIKCFTYNEFIKKYCFDYDEEAILFIMNKYSVKYEVAKVYIDNLYYIEDKTYNIKKLDFLVSLKKELDNHKLLIYNDAFKKYLSTIDIIVFNQRLTSFFTKLLSNVKYRVINRKLHNYEHDIISFDTMEQEVEYVSFNICKLLSNGIDINKIKLTNIDSSYYNTIERIFRLNGLRVNIKYQEPLSSYSLIKNFISLLDNNTIEEALSRIDSNDFIYNYLVDTINDYAKYDNINLLIHAINNTYITSPKYDKAIDIIDFLTYQVDDDEYVFMLGFNDGIIPKSYKDIDYITDNIKSFVLLEDTATKNNYLHDDILKSIANIRNLTITYKLKDNKRNYYPSTLCNNFKIISGTEVNNISYSDTFSKIKLTRYLDDYLKYGYKHSDLELLYNNFETKYNSYDNKYQKIDRLQDKLTLSYSKMQIYNKCAFRYYLTDILKLDIFCENFSTIIGSMVHFVMEKCLSNNDNDIEKYADIYLEGREFSKKELFFLEKYKICLKGLLDEAILLKNTSSLKEAMYEKKIDIPISNNVIFTGIIDKILYYTNNDTTYMALIDYKTGNDDISLKYLKYGLNIQLPIYLYLSSQLEFKNIIYSGFYLQKFNIKDNDYRLIGYSNSDKDILSKLDSNYDNSTLIKGMKVIKDGSFSKNTKVLSNDEIDNIILLTKDNIDLVVNNITNNNFSINPKVDGDINIGCDYCKFRDICFAKYNDYVNIKPDEFGGDE